MAGLNKSKLTNQKSEEPLAIIKGGKHNGEIIYFNEDGERPSLSIDNLMDHVTEKRMRKGKKGLTQTDINALKKAFEKGEIDEEVLELYKSLTSEVNTSQAKKLYIEDGFIQVLPRLKMDQTDRIQVSGCSGSGKTTWICSYGKEYRKMFPSNKVYLFSRLDRDENIDELKPKRIKITEELLDAEVDLHDFKNSLVIFDDIATISNKKICEKVKSIRDDLLETGRHENIYVIVVSHHICDNKNTKTSLLQANKITIFPHSGGAYQAHRLFKEYLGYDPKTIKMIMALPSRWITINKLYPNVILAEHHIIIL